MLHARREWRSASARRSIVVAIALGLCLRAPRAAAFSFDGFTYVHNEIIEAAFKRLGWSPPAGAIRQIENASIAQDVSEMANLDVYRPAHHFDRPVTARTPEAVREASAAAFSDGRRYVLEQKTLAITAAKTHQSAVALEAIGKGSHALEDFFAHSNFVDLCETDQQRAFAALLDESIGPPATLRITGAEIKLGRRHAGMPPGDLYQHDLFNNDSPSANSRAKARPAGTTMTRFVAAREAAIRATQLYFQQIRGSLASPSDSEMLFGKPGSGSASR